LIKTFTMLAHVYEDQQVSGWLASEKLDGCRAMWIKNLPESLSNDPGVDPTGLWTRDGKVIHAPKWWLSHLPDLPLDGELWLDRQSFQSTMSTVRKKIPDVQKWKHIKFMAIDMPVKIEPGTIKMRNAQLTSEGVQLHPTIVNQPVFKSVYNYLQKNTVENDIYRIVRQTPIKSIEHLNEMMRDVVENGGEGLMLRDPFSYWEQCRSHKLLKMKPFLYMDVEVMGYYYGDGKYYGKMGALEVKSPTGKYFKLSGFTDDERRVPTLGLPFSRAAINDSQFPNGSIITIKYRELTKDGIPKEARFHRERP